MTLWESEIEELWNKCGDLEKVIVEKDLEIKWLKIKHIENEVELGKFRQDLKILKVKKVKDSSWGNSWKRDSSWDWSNSSIKTTFKTIKGMSAYNSTFNKNMSADLYKEYIKSWMSNDTIDSWIAAALYNSKKQSKSKIVSPKEAKEEGHLWSKSTIY